MIICGKADCLSRGRKILNTPNLICPNKDLILHAMILYSEKNIDYVDAYNALILIDNGIEKLY